MIFSEFAEKILDAIRSDERQAGTSLVRTLVTEFAWSCQLEATDRAIYWGKPARETSEEFLAEIELELQAAIYICQGRIGLSYHKHLASKLSEAQILKEFQRIPFSGSAISLTQTYNSLHQSYKAIENWLENRGGIPKQLTSLVSKIPSGTGRIVIAKILNGQLVMDRTLIKFLKYHISLKGISNDIGKSLEIIYQTTLPDLGLMACILWENGIWDLLNSPLKLGLPTRPEKIQRFEKIEAVWKQTGPCFIQPKYYGLQIQIHKSNEDIHIFGRNLEDITDSQPQLVVACKQNIRADSVILDGEIVSALPDIADTLNPPEVLSVTKREAIIFDLLYVDGKDWRKQPYQKRHLKLLKIIQEAKGELRVAEEQLVTNENQLLEAWKEYMLNPKHIGVVVKLPTSLYKSAGLSEGKWKIKNYFSLDLVILGYRITNKGYAIFTVGALDEDNEKFVPVGEIDAIKALKSVNIAILTHCKEYETTGIPYNVAFNVVPRNLVTPTIILEVITSGTRVPDDRYFNTGKSRLPLRDQNGYFERPDKSLDDINTLADFLNLKLGPRDPERDQEIPY